MLILLFWIRPSGPSNIGYVCDTVFLLRVDVNVSAFVVSSNATGKCTWHGLIERYIASHRNYMKLRLEIFYTFIIQLNFLGCFSLKSESES